MRDAPLQRITVEVLGLNPSPCAKRRVSAGTDGNIR
jgi:hypothetical protein